MKKLNDSAIKQISKKFLGKDVTTDLESFRINDKGKVVGVSGVYLVWDENKIVAYGNYRDINGWYDHRTTPEFYIQPIKEDNWPDWMK